MTVIIIIIILVDECGTVCARSTTLPSNLSQNYIDPTISAKNLSIDPGIFQNLKLSPEEKINIFIQRGPCQPTEIHTNFPKLNGQRFLSNFTGMNVSMENVSIKIG
uniref:Uncharacterized protein n=1 Tax=Schizaphis graminum TaxID=13262 RepID=A0A2S2NFY6_SCHGA